MSEYPSSTDILCGGNDKDIQRKDTILSLKNKKHVTLFTIIIKND